MKFKSKSSCLTKVILNNLDETYSESSTATASATATATGSTLLEASIISDNLSLTNAFNLAYEMASNLFYNKKNLIIKDTTNVISNNCFEYIYTIPSIVNYGSSFTLNYISDAININNKFELIYNDKTISTFVPNIILSVIKGEFSENSYLSNVTINSNTSEYFVSYNIIPNSIYTVNKDNGEYNKYLDVKDGLQEPVGIEFDIYNNMYVADFILSNIKVYNKYKKEICVINHKLFQNLGGIGFNNNILYALNGLPILDKESEYYGKYIMFKIILLIDGENNITYEVSVFCTNTLDSPLFICFDKFNNGYVTNYKNNTISKINMTTGDAVVYIDETKGLLKPRGITIDKELNLYISCGDESSGIFYINKIDINKVVSIYTNKNLNSPRGLALDINGDQSLYICNLGSTLVKIISDKCIFYIKDNILEKGDNIISIKDTTDNIILDTFVLNI